MAETVKGTKTAPLQKTQSEFNVRDERKPNHHWADNEVIDLYARKIGPFGYAVYMFICRHAGNRDGRCHKSQTDIAKAFSISVDTVARAINRLMEVGLIGKEDLVGKANVYIVLEVPKRTAHSGTCPAAATPNANSGNHLPPTADGLPLTADTLPPTAVRNKEVRLSQDFSQDLKHGNGASPLPPTRDLFPNQAPAGPRMNKPDAEQDPREPFILKTIRGQWPKNCKCDIDNADMAAIRRMLRNRHRWNEAELALCIVARFVSDEYVDQGESVKAWIGAITDYQTGPKDKFGHPVYAGADLDCWREQARVILYGRQPVQAKIPEATPEQIRAAFVAKVGGHVNGRCTEAFASLQQNFIRKLSPHSYDTWLRPLRPLCLTRERVLYVLLPTADFQHIGSKYGEEIKAWIGSGDTVAQVEFVTLEELR